MLQPEVFWKTIFFNPIENIWGDTHGEITHPLVDMVAASIKFNGTEKLYLAGGRRPNVAVIDWAVEDISSCNITPSKLFRSQTNIVIDSNQNRHIVYKTNNGLFYAFSEFDKFTQQWYTEPIHSTPLGDVGAYTSLIIDSNDTLHISYCDMTQAKLSYAYREINGEWTFPTDGEYGNINETFFAKNSGNAGGIAPTCIRIGSEGRINIFFVGYDSTYGDHNDTSASYGLRYIYSDTGGTTWEASGNDFGGFQLTDWLSATNNGPKNDWKLTYRGCSSNFPLLNIILFSLGSRYEKKNSSSFLLLPASYLIVAKLDEQPRYVNFPIVLGTVVCGRKPICQLKSTKIVSARFPSSSTSIRINIP